MHAHTHADTLALIHTHTRMDTHTHTNICCYYIASALNSAVKEKTLINLWQAYKKDLKDKFCFNIKFECLRYSSF